MCSFDPEKRLNAEQAIHMLAPYAQNAKGASLSTVVNQELSKVYIQTEKGTFSGISVQVDLLNSPEETKRSLESVTDSRRSSPRTADKTTEPLHEPTTENPFWKQFTLYASGVFFGLHILSFVLLMALDSPTKDPPQQATESTYTLDISKKDIATLTITKPNKESLLKLTPSKKRTSLQVPKGNYVVTLRLVKTSDEQVQYELPITQASILSCEAKDGQSQCLLDQKPLQQRE